MKSNFLKPTTLFVDIHNVLFYTDLFLVHELYSQFEQDQTLRFFFSSNDIFTVCAHYTPQEMDNALKLETAKKKHKNYLLDLIDMKRFDNIILRTQTGTSNVALENYTRYLWNHLLQLASDEHYLQLTEYGNALLLLAKDPNFEKCYLYSETKYEFVQQQVGTVLQGEGSGKFVMVSGPKEEVLKQCQPIDSYALEDCIDLALVAKTKNKTRPAEVLIPFYTFNAAPNRSNLEVEVEQVLGPRLDLDRWNNGEFDTIVDFCKNYNLSVNTMLPPV